MLCRRWLYMDTRLSRLHTLPTFGSDRKNIVKTSGHSWVHRKPSYEPWLCFSYFGLNFGRNREIFGMPKNSRISCQRDIYSCVHRGSTLTQCDTSLKIHPGRGYRIGRAKASHAEEIAGPVKPMTYKIETCCCLALCIIRIAQELDNSVSE